MQSDLLHTRIRKVHRLKAKEAAAWKDAGLRDANCAYLFSHVCSANHQVFLGVVGEDARYQGSSHLVQDAGTVRIRASALCEPEISSNFNFLRAVLVKVPSKKCTAFDLFNSQQTRVFTSPCSVEK